MNKAFSVFLFYLLFAGNHTGFTQANNKMHTVVPKEFESQFKEDVIKYLAYTNPYLANASKAFDLWRAADKGHVTNYNVDSLYRAASALQKKFLLQVIDYIKLNPGSYTSLYYFKLRLLVSTKLKTDSLKKIYSLLTADLQATPLGQYVAESINQKQSLLLNDEMPVFSFKTDKGQVVNLSSFRGQKHVLLCFWASWCGPCVRNIPYLKKVEQEYKSKGLQVISVSLDSDTTNWLTAVAKYDLPWLQTCDLPEYVSESMRRQYQIDWIPTYFLIDKEGKLIYQSILSNEDDTHSVLNKSLQKELD